MSDPFDRLCKELGDVPVPDQWPAIEARAAAGDMPARPPRTRRARPIAWWAAAAAAMALFVTGVVLLSSRDAQAPATPPGTETVPPPDPALSCRSVADLERIVDLLTVGTERLDYGPHDRTAVVRLETTVVLDAELTAVGRAGDFLRVDIAEPTYHRGDDQVDAVSWRSTVWDEPAARDPLADPIELTGTRLIAGVEPLSSAPVWSPVPGGLIVGCAGTDVPAIDVHNGLPLLGSPSIDDLVDALVTGEPVPTTPATAPPTTVPTEVLPCRDNAELQAVIERLPIGVPVADYLPAESVLELTERVSTVFRATLTSAERSNDGAVVLHVTGIGHLAGEQADVTSIHVLAAAPWNAPDPVGSPVGFDDVELIVFATRVGGTPARYYPDIQGLFAACADDLSIVRPLLATAAFLDHSSLDAMGAQIITAQPDVGPWGRPCTDLTGASEPPLTDSLADRPFGPLAPEPGLTVLYPMAPRQPLYSDPVSSITRVPGGLLIRLRAAGPDGADQLVAVVDDGGSVRWRRCIPDMYGGSVVATDAVGHLEMYPDGGGTASEWWSFDLATGESSVDPAPPSELADASDEWPPDVFFHVDDSGVQAPLSRRSDDGRELWRRDDLFDPGGEGFRTSQPQPTSAGEVVLVRACFGAPIDSDTGPGDLPCPYALLGIDAADGKTVWQLDGTFSVPLVADGYAIVTPMEGDSWTTASALIDLATGATVPDGVAPSPGAFYEECCGGYDYNRVDHAGALAWTVAFDRLNVWFPAGSQGPGVTVDLLGPSAVPTIGARFGMPVYDVAGCGVNCRLVLATGSGFPPESTVTARCHSDRGGAWAPVGEPQTVVVSPDGSFGISDLCADGRDDGNVKVVIGEVESNLLVGG